MDMRALLIGLLAAVFFAALTGLLAARKGRDVWLWATAAFVGLFITLIGLAFFGDIRKMNQKEANESKQRENIFCYIVIGLGILNILRKFMSL